MNTSFSSALSYLTRGTHKLTQLSLLLSAGGLVAMTLIIGWQVFARYVLNDSPAWSETLALLLMLYYILLAAAVGVYEGFHLGLKILIDSLNPGPKRMLNIANNSFIALFGITMLINGVRLAQFTSNHLIPTLNVSRAFAYLPFTVAGLFITVFALERLLVAFSNSEI